MAKERTGGEGARITLELLWGARDRAQRTGLSVQGIVAAAIGIADREGLDALSMRRVAQELGVGTMSLYRHVPGKAELLDLMFDAVLGATLEQPRPQGDWRARLRALAWESWRGYHEHPWMLQVSQARPPLGPNVLAIYEELLQVVDGIGLSPTEMNAAVLLVADYAAGAARRDVDLQSGESEESWWGARESFWQERFDRERFPMITKLWVDGTTDERPETAFAFGVERILDGIDAHLRGDGAGG